MATSSYTTQLQAGLGLVDDTKQLLDLWRPGMTASQLHQKALESGRFPNVTARRLRNIVSECFAPRYLVSRGAPAHHMKTLAGEIAGSDLIQLMLLFTSRANPILGDFIRTVYWARYVGGYTEISNDDARQFVERAIDDGKTAVRWSETTVRRVSAYLTGCCADYGLLGSGARSSRRLQTFRISHVTAAYLAYDLHFSGVGDNALLAHADWELFGLAREDVLGELKKLSLKGLMIVQAAGDAVRISWKQTNMEDLCDVLAQG
ncbi:MAG: DUF1819 family protein [Alphaproteobacteria bacterium]|nr:MAG: DUF1819 family protein [Alphaproteobacteria bacterium]